MNMMRATCLRARAVCRYQPTRVTAFSTSTDGVPAPVYEAPMSRAVRLMKGVSVTSCTLTSIGMPILCTISEQSTSMAGKWAMCGTVVFFGVGTTSLFHYLFKPYVTKMWLEESSEDTTVTIETVSLFARPTTHEFLLSQVGPPEKSMHPMINFSANGDNFFVHPECFQDTKLASRLLGRDVSKEISKDK